ncbi:MAG TPA: glycosyltransferase family 39 protein [Anaerolineales bacterium]|nr:glycosyltransferase family 39 protein [Anaerolineales bacterium]
MRKRLPWFPRNNQILAILTLSVLLRLIAALYLGDSVEILPGTYDQVSYHNLALRVLDGHGFSFGEPWWPLTAANAPTAHWSYLYTFYLVLVYALFGPHPLAARLIQALLVGLLQPLLAFLIARRVFGQLVALATAALTAVYTYFIYYTATLMTEPFYITAILASLYLAILIVDRISASEGARSVATYLGLPLALGVSLGISVLLRQLFLAFVPFIFLWIWWISRKPGVRSTIPALLVTSLILGIMTLPFTLYNYTRFGRFVLLNTNAGYAFFWANHPIYGTQFEPILPPEMGTYQSLIPTELRGLDEAALDQALLERGLKFVLDDPIRYLRLSLSRIPAYFMFWPSRDSGLISNISRVSSFGLFFPFMLYGILVSFLSGRRGMLGRSEEQAKGSRPHDHSTTPPPNFRPSTLPSSDPSNPTFQSSSFPPSNPTPNRSSPTLNVTSPIFLLVLFALIYTLIHLLSWSLVRYRLPVDAVLLVFAGLAAVDLFQRVVSLRDAAHVHTRST